MSTDGFISDLGQLVGDLHCIGAWGYFTWRFLRAAWQGKTREAWLCLTLSLLCIRAVGN
jgi:predicted acetyltransferase